MKHIKIVRNFINTIIDFISNQLVRFSVWRWHIMFMFIFLGIVLVILPIFGIAVVFPFKVKADPITELVGGNYTNIISAGVSLLTLSAAIKIKNDQTIRHNEHMKVHHDHAQYHKKLEKHLGIDQDNTPTCDF